MAQPEQAIDLRVARLEEELEALVREVELLREEIRSFAHVVGRGEVTTGEAS